MVEPIACRSISAGLHGTNAISAARAASRAAVSVCGAVSRIANVAPFSSASCRICDNRSECVEITAGVSPSRLSLHFAAEDCGSRSIKAVVCPARSAATDIVCGEGCLAGPAFPTQDCECFHFYLRLCHVASVHTCTYASVILCRFDVLHTEVKTLDVGYGFKTEHSLARERSAGCNSKSEFPSPAKMRFLVRPQLNFPTRRASTRQVYRSYQVRKSRRDTSLPAGQHPVVPDPQSLRWGNTPEHRRKCR